MGSLCSIRTEILEKSHIVIHVGDVSFERKTRTQILDASPVDCLVVIFPVLGTAWNGGSGGTAANSSP